MKKLTLLLALLGIIVAIVGCSTSSSDNTAGESTLSSEASPSTEIEETTEAETEAPKRHLTLRAELAALEGVTAVSRITAKVGEKAFPALAMTFTSGDLSMTAEIVLPADWQQTNCPIVLYFPEINYAPADLAHNFAVHGIGVVKLTNRGTDQNEGIKDLGGEDLADCLALLDIIKRSDFLKDRTRYLMGASEGSIRALRLAAERPEDFAACFVANAITDIPTLLTHRPDWIPYTEAAIGKTREEAPEEYAKRSAVTFADRLSLPITVVLYEGHPDAAAYTEQAEMLMGRLREIGMTEITLLRLEGVGSDFTQEAWKRLYPVLLP